jgi:pimeloyl-ACP methyl ester carboxylesterase
MELFFRKVGIGAPLIILHGLYGASDNWITIGKHLAKKYTVYMLDQRNHGRSPFASSHTYSDLVNDLEEFFHQHNIAKATLLGHSMGGKVAMWFAVNFPEKTEELIVADIAPKDYLLEKNDSSFRVHKIILQAIQEIDFSLVNSRNDADILLAKKIGDTRIRQFLLKNIVKDNESKQYRWRINATVLYNYINEIVGGVNKNWLEQKIPITNYPVTFIRGAKSNYILPEDKMLIKETYPDAKIIDISYAGHWLHAEQPGKFVEAVLTD